MCSSDLVLFISADHRWCYGVGHGWCVPRELMWVMNSRFSIHDVGSVPRTLGFMHIIFTIIIFIIREINSGAIGGRLQSLKIFEDDIGRTRESSVGRGGEGMVEVIHTITGSYQ